MTLIHVSAVSRSTTLFLQYTVLALVCLPRSKHRTVPEEILVNQISRSKQSITQKSHRNKGRITGIKFVCRPLERWFLFKGLSESFFVQTMTRASCLSRTQSALTQKTQLC